MRSRSGILAVLAVATLLAGVATGQPAASQVVRDLRGRFTIIVPVTWHIKQLLEGDPALAATASGEAGTLPDSVDVVVRGAPVGISAEGCIHQVEWITQHLAHISFTTVGEGPMMIGGLPAYTHTYTWRTRTGEDRWSMQACVVAEHQCFVITGTTSNPPDRVREAATVLTSIIESFLPTPQLSWRR